MRIVLSLTQLIWKRPGTRMIAAAPYDLQASPAGSFAGSQALAILRASGFAGIIEKSPRGGTIMRRCQCSVTTETQVPVRSLGAAARPVGGGPPPARPPRPWADATPEAAMTTMSAAERGTQARRMLLDPAPPRETVARPLDAGDQQTQRRGVAGRFAGHLELVARLERGPGDLGLGQVVGRSPLERPGLDRAVLVGDVDAHE